MQKLALGSESNNLSCDVHVTAQTLKISAMAYLAYIVLDFQAKEILIAYITGTWYIT